MEVQEGKSPASICRFVVTPACNLRCFYCHNEGFTRGDKSFVPLPLWQLERILSLLKDNGIISVCLTGGEPLLYEGFDNVLGVVAEIFGGAPTHVSTNGVFLDKHLNRIREVGVERINVSCDAVDEATYARISGGNCFKEVIANVERAVALGFFVNVNCVALKGINTDRKYIESILEFWKGKGVRLSFLRLCFSVGSIDAFRYDMNELISLLESMGLESYLVPHTNRPPTLCYRYEGMEVALRYYVPNRSTYPCTECTKRDQCSEGLYHPRLGLNGILRACILREDLSLDLRSEHPLGVELSRFLRMFDEIPGSWEPATCDSP